MSESWDMLKIASMDKIHQEYRMKQMPELFDVQKTVITSYSIHYTKLYETWQILLVQLLN